MVAESVRTLVAMLMLQAFGLEAKFQKVQRVFRDKHEFCSYFHLIFRKEENK